MGIDFGGRNGECDILEVRLLCVAAVVSDINVVGDRASDGLPAHAAVRAPVPFGHAKRLGSGQAKVEMARFGTTATGIDHGCGDGLSHIRHVHAHSAVLALLE